MAGFRPGPGPDMISGATLLVSLRNLQNVLRNLAKVRIRVRLGSAVGLRLGLGSGLYIHSFITVRLHVMQWMVLLLQFCLSAVLGSNLLQVTPLQ